MKTKMRMFLTSIMLFGIVLSTTGCFIKPYNKPAVVQIETNETAFLVDMRSDESTSADSMTLIQRKDVVIDGYWVQTGRMGGTGYYRPNSKVLVVSRRPVEVRWDGEGGNPVVKAVSSESVGFQIPLVVNATIQSDENALLYLNWFRSNTNNGDVGENNNAMEKVREEAEPLESAVNRIIFPVINNVLSGLFLEVPIIECESNRVDFVRQAYDAAAEEAAKYGITLLILSSTDGLLYDDPEFQNRINQLAVEKMRENVLAQENMNALAQQEVEKTKANTEAEVARIQANIAAEIAKSQELTLDIQSRQIDIEGRRTLYTAEAEAIKMRARNPWPEILVVQDLETLGQLGVIPSNSQTINAESEEESQWLK